MIVRRHPSRAPLALIAIALLMQALAPGAAARMASARPGAPAGLVICTKAGPQPRHAPDHPAGGDCGSGCPVCAASAQTAILGAAPEASPSASVARLDRGATVLSVVAAAAEVRPRARGPPTPMTV